MGKDDAMKPHLFDLPEEIFIFSKRLAGRQGITMAEFLRRALAEKINRDMLVPPSETAAGTPTIQPAMAGWKLEKQ